MTTSVRIPPPPAFSGKQTRNNAAGAWLFQVENYFELQQLDFENLDHCEWMLKFVGSLFQDDAAEWYMLQRHREFVPWVTWNAFRTAFLSQFRPLNPVKEARDELHDLRQVNSVAKYVERFNKLSLQIGNELSETEAFDRFLRGLKPGIRKACEQQQVQDLEEAKDLAQRLDAIDYYYARRDRLAQQADSRRNDPMELGAMRHEEQVNGLKDGRPGKDNRPIHYGSGNVTPPRAPTPPPYRAPTPPPQRRGGLSQEERQYLMDHNLCFTCKEGGHYYLQCPKRRMGQPQAGRGFGPGRR